MRTTLKFLAIALLTVATFACKPTVADNRDAITSAENEIEKGQFDQARQICESIVEDAEAAKLLTATDYCRIALAMKKISDSTDANDLTASAVKAYQSAQKLSGDSIMAFLTGLQPDDASKFLNIMLIADGQTAAINGGIGEDIDTVAIETISIDSLPQH